MPANFNIKNKSSGTFADHEVQTTNVITYNLNSQPSGTGNQQWTITLYNKPGTSPVYQITSVVDGSYLTVDDTGRQLVCTSTKQSPRLFEFISHKVNDSFDNYIIRDVDSGLVWTLPSSVLKTRVTLANYDGSDNQIWTFKTV